MSECILICEYDGRTRENKGNSHMFPQTLQAVISVEVSFIFHKIGKVFRQAKSSILGKLEGIQDKEGILVDEFIYLSGYE